MKSPARMRSAFVWTAGLIVIPLRLMATSEPSRHAVEPWTTLSNLLGYTAMSLFVISVILLASWKPIDRLIAPRGQRLCLHHQLGIAVLVMAFLHGLLLTARFLPDDLYRALMVMMPFHRRWEVNIGIWGFYGLAATISAVVIHGAPKLWRWIHRTSIIWITLAAIHTQLTGPDWSEGLLLNLYLWMLYAIAIASLISMYVHRFNHQKHTTHHPRLARPCAAEQA